MPDFGRVLVANRGEIALRVLRALRTLGIESAITYSDADATALPTAFADRAYRLPGVSAVDTYLNAEAIVEVARQCDADAIHPGYGFLSENAAFARLCREHSIGFVGPTSETLATSGNKIECKKLAEANGVPVVPYSREALEDPEEAARFASDIGFPVLLKSAFGGGGRGIREATSREEVRDAFSSVRREAESAFGRAAVFVEKRLQRPRHIEVQIFGNSTGSEVIPLGERECSIQRRYQKLVEISPSPVVDEESRARLADYAATMARAVRYANAGTVEFLRDSATGALYFLEVNARLQVEHPVTELVTGLDLVAAQFAVAQHGSLPFRPENVRPRGVAIECRINSEDPLHDFLPVTGRIEHLRIPAGPGIRVDTALTEGMEVTPYYDSLLAKAVAWGATFEEARARELAALNEFRVVGVPTTIPFHREVMVAPRFIAGDLSTAFLDESGILPRLAERAREADPDRFAIAAFLLAQSRAARTPARSLGSRGRPTLPNAGVGGRFVDGL